MRANEGRVRAADNAAVGRRRAHLDVGDGDVRGERFQRCVDPVQHGGPPAPSRVDQHVAVGIATEAA